MPKWNLLRCDKFDDDVRKLGKKYPNAVRAVMVNLNTLKEVLEEVDNPSKVNCKFLSSEGGGLFRVSELGAGRNVTPIRIYLTFEVVDRDVVLHRMHLKGPKAKQTAQINAIKKELQKK